MKRVQPRFWAYLTLVSLLFSLACQGPEAVNSPLAKTRAQQVSPVRISTGQSGGAQIQARLQVQSEAFRLQSDLSNVRWLTLILLAAEPGEVIIDDPDDPIVINQTVSHLDMQAIEGPEINLLFDNLQFNTHYHLMAQAWGDDARSQILTKEGQPAVSQEFIQVDHEGRITLMNDNGNQIWDLLIELDAYAGSVRPPVDISSREGARLELGVGSYGLVPQQPINHFYPALALNEQGSGLVVWVNTQDALGTYRTRQSCHAQNFGQIYGMRIRDNAPQGHPFRASNLTMLSERVMSPNSLSQIYLHQGTVYDADIYPGDAVRLPALGLSLKRGPLLQVQADSFATKSLPFYPLHFSLARYQQAQKQNAPFLLENLECNTEPLPTCEAWVRSGTVESVGEIETRLRRELLEPGNGLGSRNHGSVVQLRFESETDTVGFNSDGRVQNLFVVHDIERVTRWPSEPYPWSDDMKLHLYPAVNRLTVSDPAGLDECANPTPFADYSFSIDHFVPPAEYVWKGKTLNSGVPMNTLISGVLEIDYNINDDNSAAGYRRTPRPAAAINEAGHGLVVWSQFMAPAHGDTLQDRLLLRHIKDYQVNEDQAQQVLAVGGAYPALSLMGPDALLAYHDENNPTQVAIRILRSAEADFSAAPLEASTFSITTGQGLARMEPALSRAVQMDSETYQVLLVWTEFTSNPNNAIFSSQIRGRIFTYTPGSGSLAAAGNSFVLSDPNGAYRYPALAASPSGEALVVWQNEAVGMPKIQGRYLSAGFVPTGDVLNIVPASGISHDPQKIRPQLALDRLGNGVLTWTDEAAKSFKDANDRRFHSRQGQSYYLPIENFKFLNTPPQIINQQLHSTVALSPAGHGLLAGVRDTCLVPQGDSFHLNESCFTLHFSRFYNGRKD